MTLRDLRNLIAQRLLKIEDDLGPDYRLSLIARHATNPRAHILVTIDATVDIRRALDELETDPGTTTVPGSECVPRPGHCHRRSPGQKGA